MRRALIAVVLAAGAVSAAERLQTAGDVDMARYAVVDEPSRQHLWVLSRTPTLSLEDRRAIEARLPAHGYDAARLVDSPPENN